MINRFLSKHRKGVSAVLLSIFFAQTTLSTYAFVKLPVVPAYSLPVPKQLSKQIQKLQYAPLSENTEIIKKDDRVETVASSNPRILTPPLSVKGKKIFEGPGPGQPEMQSFASVSSSNMVDLFTGDFSYSIPLLDVGGYPVNIHYRSGITMDQEASWVGLGWNINPGAITRNMRGIPDDFNGEDIITKKISIRENWTAGGQFGVALELFGFDTEGLLNKAVGGKLTLNGSGFYNNYKGIGLSTGVGFQATAAAGSKGLLTGDIGMQVNSQNGASVNTGFGATFYEKTTSASGSQSSGFSASSSYNTRAGLQNFTISFQGKIKQKSDAQNNKAGANATISGDLVNISFAHQAYTPTISIPYTSHNFSLSFKPGGEITGIHPSASFGGFYSKQFIAEEDKTMRLPAVGYMNFQKAEKLPANTLLDFNREKELVYRTKPRTPHIAIPNYTYDIYSISGEGNGGMFRPYRNDLGYMYDPEVKTKSLSGGLSVDLGAGNAAHVGVDVKTSFASTKTGKWEANNLLGRNVSFQESDGVFEAVYFKNPAEKTIVDQNFLDKIGDTDPVVPVTTGKQDVMLNPFLQRYKDFLKVGDKLPINNQTLPLRSKARDKRSQVISYLSANDASLFALSKNIERYPINTYFAGACGTPICAYGNCTGNEKILYETRVNDERKKHHLSEMTVLNPDGKRYIYGLPVYNYSQKEVSFSVEAGDKKALETGLVSYESDAISLEKETSDNSIGNRRGKDHFYSSDEVPPYAHSFLLTGIVSADYVDKTGEITDDDMGDAVKFNYSRVYGQADPKGLYRWRTPYAENTATYNEGLKTDNSDDKGSYVYGKKEIWYLNSIESKTMIATFVLNDEVNDKRLDGLGVSSENGGADNNQSLRKLKRIDLYTKSEYLEKGSAARPIKSVYFDYSYDLCNGNPSSSGNTGKLTLTKIWFTYNKNDKGEQNPYLFYYHPVDLKKNLTNPKTEYNPPYHAKSNDRWGAYKDSRNNPAALTNSDYPYTLQDGDKTGSGTWDAGMAAVSTSVWTLSDIKLPSGGRMNIEYESDDYAYVQNRRAMQMLNIVGIGNSNKYSENMNKLYNVHDEHKFVFIKVPNAIEANTSIDQKKEIKQKYLEGVEKLFFKLKVKMPGDIYGEGYENVTTYAQYEDYGLTTDKNIIWLRLKGTDVVDVGDGDASPLAKTAIQTLRLNLPSKAYPNSDLNGEFSMVAIVKASVGLAVASAELIENFAVRARILGWAKEVKLDECFVRLDNPTYKKYGDGLRVKRITVFDNWEKMTEGQEQEATYGQEYDYTTVADIEGKKTVISSGVACWEPGVGNEENPFRLPIEYKDQIAPFAPINNLYSEFPLGEGFFPSPSVGYSKVRTRTIHYKDVKSANGYDEIEYYTSRDFPTITEHTDLDGESYNPPDILEVFNFSIKRAMSFTQGFKVELNDMNGKVKRTASYSEEKPNEAFAYSEYYYKETFNGKVRQLENTVAAITKADGTGTRKAQIGKDVELMLDFREQESESWAASVEFNTDGFVIGFPLVIAALFAFPREELSRYRSAAALKVVQRYGILDKVIAYDKGSKITTENVLYDGETGDVLLTKTQNEFEDPIYNFTYPAHWAYSGMEPAYKNIGAIFTGLNISDGRIVGNTANNVVQNLESGDELKVSGGTERGKKNNGLNCDGFGGCDTYDQPPTITKKLWAIHSSKIQNKNGLADGIYIIDEAGKFFNGEGVTLQVLRSGKRNQQAVPVGTVTSLKEPTITTTGDNFKIVFDASSRVINSSAATFADFWKVEDARYKPLTKTIRRDAVVKETFHPINSFSVLYNHLYRGSNCALKVNAEFVPYINTPYIESIHRRERNASCGTLTRMKSWMEFDLSGIPASATVLSSSLALFPHLGDHEEDNRGFDWDNSTRDHTSSNPHKYADGEPRPQLEYAMVERVTNAALFNNLNLNNLSRVIDAGNGDTRRLYNNAGKANPVRIIMSRKQNSVLLDTKELAQGLVSDRSVKSYIQLGPQDNEELLMETLRFCFWSQNQMGDGNCSAYEPMPDPNNTVDLAKTNISPRSSDDQNAPAISISDPGGCNSPACSIVKSGSGKFPCSTAPTLTIEYISCQDGERIVEDCGKYYCEKTVPVDECISQISDTATNPYRWGILGNWRLKKNYVYYGNRTESSITNSNGETDIRNMGTIANYSSYWSFTSTKISGTTSEAIWVWNTESTLFNRKGFELENKDPLGRYNSAQYGYNETMPVAVTQNATYQQQAFDGFEDYGYKNDNCNDVCKIQAHLDKTAFSANITNEESHSGFYSAGVEVGKELILQTDAVDANSSANTASLTFYSTSVQRTSITNVYNGTGLQGTVFSNFDFLNDNYGLDQYNYSKGTAAPRNRTGLPPVFNSSGNVQNFGIPVNASNYKIVFDGYLTLRKNSSTDLEGQYEFAVAADDSYKLWIDDKLVLNAFPNDPPYYNSINGNTVYSRPMRLGYGRAYKVRIEFVNGPGLSSVRLVWRRTTQPTVVSDLTKENFHPTLASAQSRIAKSNITCTNNEGIRASKDVLYKEFTVKADMKYVVSAWVKEQKDCKCETYENAALQIIYRDAGGNTIGQSALLKPSGSIIEGWQRIEEVVDIPANTSKIEIHFKALQQNGNQGKIFFDDWRMHPFNANMKSFVYSAENLRLLAELDENNYASFYEYDDDGTLVRVKKETERGVKTIKETRSTLIKEK